MPLLMLDLCLILAEIAQQLRCDEVVIIALKTRYLMISKEGDFGFQYCKTSLKT